MRDYQTDARTQGRTDGGQSDPYVPLCFVGDTKITDSSSFSPFSHKDDILKSKIILHDAHMPFSLVLSNFEVTVESTGNLYHSIHWRMLKKR